MLLSEVDTSSLIRAICAVRETITRADFPEACERWELWAKEHGFSVDQLADELESRRVNAAP